MLLRTTNAVLLKNAKVVDATRLGFLLYSAGERKNQSILLPVPLSVTLLHHKKVAIPSSSFIRIPGQNGLETRANSFALPKERLKWLRSVGKQWESA